MRQFGIDIEQINPDDFEGREFYDTVNVCGREIDLYLPTPEQFALIFWRESAFDNVSNMLDILGHMMTTANKMFVRQCILAGALNIEALTELCHEVVDAFAEVAEFPTKRSSASTRTRKGTGRPSTANSRRVASGRGTSPRPASATSSTGD